MHCQAENRLRVWFSMSAYSKCCALNALDELKDTAHYRRGWKEFPAACSSVAAVRVAKGRTRYRKEGPLRVVETGEDVGSGAGGAGGVDCCARL